VLYFHAFFGFDRLVQPVGPSSARHHAARERIDYYDLAVLDHVIDFVLLHAERFYAYVHMVAYIRVFGIRKIFYSEIVFGFFYAVFGQNGRLRLFVHDIVFLDVLVGLFFVEFLDFEHSHALDQFVGFFIKIRGFVALPRYDQRGPGFVD